MLSYSSTTTVLYLFFLHSVIILGLVFLYGKPQAGRKLFSCSFFCWCINNEGFVDCLVLLGFDVLLTICVGFCYIFLFFVTVCVVTDNISLTILILALNPRGYLSKSGTTV